MNEQDLRQAKNLLIFLTKKAKFNDLSALEAVTLGVAIRWFDGVIAEAEKKAKEEASANGNQ